MDFKKIENLPPPPGIFSAFKTGFNSVANHAASLLLPILLDGFLWLGPHLKIEKLLTPIIQQFPQWANSGTFSPEDIQRAQKIWEQFAHQFNLFSVLRTFPIGISSLMVQILPLQTPFGTPVMHEIPSGLETSGWILLLTLLGWIGGGLYFTQVAAITSPEGKGIGAAKGIAQTFLLSALWIAFLFLTGIPTLLFFSILTLISPLLAQIVFFFFMFGLMWLIVPIFFAPHGIFTEGKNAFRSILQSLQIARFALPGSSFFIFGIFLANQISTMLWSAASDSSWLMLLAIFGHAFVATGLLAASFVYYRDTRAWIQSLVQEINARGAGIKI